MSDRPFNSDLLKTLDKNNYKEKKITFVSIDSRDELRKNNYEVELNHNFSNIESIRLKQIQFPNCIAPINKYNNKIRFTIPNETDYNSANCISLSGNPFPTDTKEYMIEIPVGFYTVEELQNTIEEKMSSVKLDIDISSINEVKENLLSFKVFIDPITYKTTFINILEERNISSIQTCLHPNTFSIGNLDNKIYEQFNLSILRQIKCNSDCIYISFSGDRSNQRLINILDNSYLPIIPMNIPSIGGIKNNIINNRNYYNIKKKPVGYNGPTYKVKIVFIPTIPSDDYLFIPYFYKNVSGLNTYLFVIELKVKDFDNNPINAKYNQMIIHEEFLSEATYKITPTSFKSKKLNLQQIVGNFNIKTTNKYPMFGRGYFFDFILDKDKNEDGSNNSLLLNLGWSIDCNKIQVSNKCKYKTIHTNLDFEVEDKINFYVSNSSFQQPIFPENFFLFQKLNNTTTNILSNHKYIFMKIKLMSGSIETPKLKDIFCKIMLDPNFNLIVNNNFTQNVKFFYQNEIDNLNKLQISFVDKNGNLLELVKDHNFTLEIIESFAKLKNTNYNTKSNTINKITSIYNLNTM